MKGTEALDALKPFTSTVPRKALDWIRANWSEAEPALLAELDEKLKNPTGEERDARFIYALYLCADMRCADAFPRYLALCRLPNVVLDYVLGDILTEHMPEMLARTCAGRTGELQALAEDVTVNEFARWGGMDALMSLMLEGEISREWLSNCCVDLMRNPLLRQPSAVWECLTGITSDIQADGALPLIEKAYERGLVGPDYADVEDIREKFALSPDVVLARAHRRFRQWGSLEGLMNMIVKQWGTPEKPEPPQALLEILKKHRRRPSETRTWVAGRNDPCPCGSGRKFKKCCLGKPAVEIVEPVSVKGRPVPAGCQPANDWMEAGYLHQAESGWENLTVYECWKAAWGELRVLLPPTLQNPDDVEDSGAFEGRVFFSAWLQDFATVLVELSKQSLVVLQYAVEFIRELLVRFPLMHKQMQSNFKEDLARCLAMSGQGEEALAMAESMIAEMPEKAQGYVLWAEMRSDEASGFNLRPDVPAAVAQLERALECAEDCEDYDVARRLEKLKAWQCLAEEVW